MTSLSTPLSSAEIDDLARFLDALPSAEAMNIERLDGFLCALFVGPEIVLPGEYWPYIVGSDMDEFTPAAFETVEQAEAITQLVARHGNTIAQALNNNQPYQPLTFEDENGGTDWAMGFMDGVALRDAGWQSFLDDDEHAAALMPVMALASEDDPELKQHLAPLLSAGREQILEMVPDSLKEMYDYFAPMRAPSTSTSPVQPVVRGEAKIGRNNSCPCGSGKKYKQCSMTKMH